jgi:acetyl/propionyl-CoA carboxylase alpha subunit
MQHRVTDAAIIFLSTSLRLPRLIIRIIKKNGDGDMVKAGETIMVFELMEMEISLNSPVSERITAIKIQAQ